MIINSIIAGAGGGVDIHFQTFKPTQALTTGQFFSTYDIRFHYKNSLLFIYTTNYQASNLDSGGRIKFYCLCNATNYTEDYTNWAITRSAQANYNWYNLIQQGAKTNIPHSNYSVDATTGRISFTGAGVSFICDNGTSIATFEIPIPPQNASELIIDTTPWGS